jgi:hypothetical protein
MPLTAVRFAATREFVGIYAVDDTYELCSFVDETCTPSECEYAVLPNGGMVSFSAAAAAAVVPLPHPSVLDIELGIAPNFNELMPNLRPTAGVSVALHDKHLVWEPLDPMVAHPGSQLSALLSTPAGRAHLARIPRSTHR